MFDRVVNTLLLSFRCSLFSLVDTVFLILSIPSNYQIILTHLMFVFPYTFDVCFSVLSINSFTAVIFVFRCCNFPILSIPSNYQISHESFIVVNKIRGVLRFGWWFLDVLMITYFILTHSVFCFFAFGPSCNTHM